MKRSTFAFWTLDKLFCYISSAHSGQVFLQAGAIIFYIHVQSVHSNKLHT